MISRQNNFNLIRLILASAVICGHASELVDGNRHREPLTRIFGSLSLGEFAVDGFFLLSGYLIMQSWEGQPHAWQFLKKRLLRIYPGFLIASLVCAFVVGPLAADPGHYFRTLEPSQVLSGMLFLQIPVVPAVFQGQPYPSINGSMWTISREFACYLVVLVLGVSGALRVRHVWLGLTILLFAYIAMLKLQRLPVHDFRLLSFFMSGACYYLYRDRLRSSGRLAAFAALVCALGLCSWRASELVFASIGAYAFFYVAGKRSSRPSRFDRLPDVSYGIYLYGWPIQKLWLWYQPWLSPFALCLLALPTACLAGMASWYLVEKPALRLKAPANRVPKRIPDAVRS